MVEIIELRKVNQSFDLNQKTCRGLSCFFWQITNLKTAKKKNGSQTYKHTF